jgi:hypothetical protein
MRRIPPERIVCLTEGGVPTPTRLDTGVPDSLGCVGPRADEKRLM